MKAVIAPTSNLNPPRKLAAFWRAVWPFAAYWGLTIVFSWPLSLNLSQSGVSARSADLWQNLWNLWWMKHALLELHTNPFQTDLLFYPDHPSLYLHALNPLGGLMSIPLQAVFGLVTAHNLLVLLGFTLSGYAAYQLGRYLRLSAGAAFLAGLTFAYSPILSSELDLGQLEQITAYWLPLFVLFFLKALNSEASSPSPSEAKGWRDYLWPAAFWRNCLLAAITLLCTALTTWYYAIDLVIFAALAGLALSLSSWRLGRADVRAFAIRLAALALSCGVLLTPWLWVTARAALNTPTAAARSSSVRYNSASLLDFFRPGESLLWFSGPIEGQEFYQFLGYIALVLAAIGLFGCWREARGWFGLLAFFLIFALGPQFKTGLDSYLDFPLPGALLQRLPIIGGFFRVPVRLLAFAMLPLGLLAGIGFDWLSRKLAFRLPQYSWAKFAFGGLVAGLIFLEYFPGPRQTADLGLDLAAWKQIQPPGAVLSLPFGPLGGGIPMYEQTGHGQPIIGGYLARLPGFDFVEQAPIIRELTQGSFKPSAPDFVSNNFETTLLPALNIYGVRYLVIHRELLSVKQSAALDKTLQPLLENNPPIARAGKLEIYRVPEYKWPDNPLPGWVDQGKGWYEEETSPAIGTYRWAEREATLTLLNPNPRPVRYRLEWSLFGYRQTYPVQLSLNGFSIGQKEASPTLQQQAFEIELPPGRSTLVIKTTQAAQRPSEAEPNNRDPRPLAFALAHLRLTLI